MFLPSFKTKVILLLLIVSTALTILSIVLIVHIIPGLLDDEIYKSVKLERGTEQYDHFIELPFPLIFKVYFFNVENPNDVLAGQKPIVKEVGPYVYNEYRHKTIIHSKDQNDTTISYIEKTEFEFDQEASGKLSDTDFITTLNSPLMGMLETADKIGQTSLISECIKDIFPEMDTVFIKIRVKDILFDGLQFCEKHLSMCEIQRTVVCKMTESKKNMDVNEDGSLRFSYFNYKNKTADVFTISSGIENIHSLGEILQINNSMYTHFWEKYSKNSECDLVKGGRSTVFPPQISKNNIFKIYSSDICRSINIKFLKEDSYQGINGYVFAPNNLTFRKNSETNEDCYCPGETQDINGKDSCFLDGVIDMAPCTGAPVLFSFPHFLWADEAYVNGVVGMSPNEELHRNFLLVEPATGTPLQAVNRIQINTVVRPINHVKQSLELPRVVLPLLWVEERVSLTDKYVAQLKDNYLSKIKIIDIVKWVFLGITSFSTIGFSGYFIWKYAVHS